MPETRHRILVIDDSAEDRDTYRNFLCADPDCGYDFVEAELGQDGLELLLRERFDAVLLDYRLPDFSGLDFLERLGERAGSEHAPIVMITGQGDERVAVLALKRGACDYIVKDGLSPESVRRATRNAIDRRAQETRLAEETEKLRVTREQLELLVEGARDHAMILLDRDGYVTQWNRGAESVTGFRADEALGRHFELLFDEADRKQGRPAEELERAIRGGRHEVDRWLVRRDGRPFWATGSVSPLLSANGSVRGFAKIVRDGTEKRRFEEERLNEGRWFESLLDFLPVPFVLVSPPTGEIRFANQAAHRAAGGEFPFVESFADYERGFALEDLEGRPLAIDQLPVARAARGEPVHGVEVTWMTPAGRRPLLVDSTLIAPLYGRESVVALVFQDISAIRQAQEALRTARHRAENADRAKSDFLANMSHEIRTPLGAIIGFTDLLVRKPAGDEERARFGAVIRRNGRALMQIIDDILDLSKVEAGKLDLEIMDVEIRALVAEVAELLAVRATERGIALSTSVDAPVPRSLATDPTRLRQILFNVLGNAIKFTEKGSVDLRVHSGDGGGPIELQVTDTGVGIEAEQQARLFQPFSQADSSTTRRFGGTGLGLMLSKRLAQALGGDFVLTRSEPGKGSVFTVTLPSGPAAATGATPVVDAPAPPSPAPRGLDGTRLDGARILLIEDSDDHRFLLERALRSAGAAVTAVRDGGAAIESARRARFDLVLTDIQLPGIDGYSTADALRDLGHCGPIVGLTAHAFPVDRETSSKRGIDEHLTKPIDAITLVAQIGHRLRDGRARPADRVSEAPS